MSDTYARVMRPADEPGKRRATRSGTARRSGAAPSLAAAPAPAERAPAERAPAEDQERPADRAASPVEGTFAAAAAAFLAGRDAQTGPGFSFEDVPAPKRLAPYASAIAATIERDGADVAWGRLILLYDPDGQEGWDGVFRLVAYIRADVEPEIAADPLLGEVGWSWLSEALDARVPGYAVPSGTVTRVITEGFGAKRDELPLTGFELRASWSPTGPGNHADDHDLDTLDLSAHTSAWCDCMSAAAGLEPPGTRALRPPGRG
jgi:Protein of unknown function (DUF3000)